MAGLRGWKGELLESEHTDRLLVRLHPANKVVLNYETAYVVYLPRRARICTLHGLACTLAPMYLQPRLPIPDGYT